MRRRPDQRRARATVNASRRTDGQGAALRIGEVVEERRDAERRSPIQLRRSRGPRATADLGRRRLERDERHDVDHAEPRMHAVVVGEATDASAAAVGEPADRGLGLVGLGARDREHGAVVVGVGVDVEQRRAARPGQPVEDVRPAAPPRC